MVIHVKFNTQISLQLAGHVDDGSPSRRVTSRHVTSNQIKSFPKLNLGAFAPTVTATWAYTANRSPTEAAFARSIRRLIMAPLPGRRSRTLESDDDAYSKPGTPCSTAPNDSKRQRRIAHENDSSSDESSIRAMSPASMMRKAQTTAVMKNNSGTQSGHQPGAIVRVKLTNFVTYTSAEFFPGPNLNMVIGPNGTGKSTLVCAICLGLGWPPSVRPSPLPSFPPDDSTAIR